ncbi:MAG: hypothetical protein ACXACT_17215, partial [Candidatus Thorarchaeota archaeon]
MSNHDDVSPPQNDETDPKKDILSSRVNSLIQNSIIRILLRIGIIRILLRIGRVAIYVFGFWTTFFYFWSIQGILIGVILAAIPGAGVWRRHGLVLSYTSVIFALSIAVYAWIWLLLSMLF